MKLCAFLGKLCSGCWQAAGKRTQFGRAKIQTQSCEGEGRGKEFVIKVWSQEYGRKKTGARADPSHIVTQERNSTSYTRMVDGGLARTFLDCLDYQAERGKAFHLAVRSRTISSSSRMKGKKVRLRPSLVYLTAHTNLSNR